MAEYSSTERSFTICNSYKTHNIYPNFGVSLSDQQLFRLNKINEIILLQRLKRKN